MKKTQNQSNTSFGLQYDLNHPGFGAAAPQSGSARTPASPWNENMWSVHRRGAPGGPSPQSQPGTISRGQAYQPRMNPPSAPPSANLRRSDSMSSQRRSSLSQQGLPYIIDAMNRTQISGPHGSFSPQMVAGSRIFRNGQEVKEFGWTDEEEDNLTPEQVMELVRSVHGLPQSDDRKPPPPPPGYAYDMHSLVELPDWISKVIPIRRKFALLDPLGEYRTKPAADYAPYYSRVELVASDQWITEIPERSALHKHWSAGGWNEWPGFFEFRPFPLNLGRSAAGMLIKEGYGVAGQILPIAHLTDHTARHMIFSTTADQSRYFMFEEGSEVKFIGSYKNLDHFWTAYSPSTAKTTRDVRNIYQVTRVQRLLRVAFEHAGGDARALYECMHFQNMEWWDFCRSDRNLKRLLTIEPFLQLVRDEQRMGSDHQYIPSLTPLAQYEENY
ncbi:hypothetical protein B0H11DRAFT_1992361 [Mycena galericulata]|nr:hypothetical protein B0H11DRAFT_1992361 [Mycena galericulata]